tara:strand:+ start:608 stop:2134 length:1527 start_codon:yes stop_codon:yes gene_type:complete
MATTIKVQVEDLIGTLGDDVLLTDSAQATLNEIVNVTPEEGLSFFLAKSSAIESATATQVEYRKNMSVWRNGIECIKVDKGMETRINDTSSIFYPTNDNPVYILDSTGVTIKPDPNDSGSGAAYIYSVTVPTLNATSATWNTGLPDGAERLVIYGAAAKCLQKKLSDARTSFTMPPASPNLDIAPSSLTLESPPTIPSITENTLSFTQSPPLYTKPIFNPPVFPTISALNLPSPPVVPSTSSQSVTITGTAPIYTGPVVAPDFSDLDNWIDVEEDDIMANVRINAINARLSEYGNKMQDALNYFNKENAEYQAILQKNIQDAQFDDAEEARKLQKYQLEISNYQAEVDSKVKDWQLTEYTKKIDEYTQEYANGLQKYANDMQNELNLFNANLNEYQTEFQRSAKNADISSQNDQIKLEKFSQDLAKYQSKAGNDIQEFQSQIDRVSRKNADKINKYQSDLQKYQSELQKNQNEHQQILQEISTLSGIYQQGLQLYIQGSVGQALGKEE